MTIYPSLTHIVLNQRGSMNIMDVERVSVLDA